MGQEIQPKSLPKIAAALPCPVTAHPLPAGKIAGGWSIPAIAAQLGARGDSLGAEKSRAISNLTLPVRAYKKYNKA